MRGTPASACTRREAGASGTGRLPIPRPARPRRTGRRPGPGRSCACRPSNRPPRRVWPKNASEAKWAQSTLPFADAVTNFVLPKPTSMALTIAFMFAPLRELRSMRRGSTNGRRWTNGNPRQTAPEVGCCALPRGPQGPRAEPDASGELVDACVFGARAGPEAWHSCIKDDVPSRRAHAQARAPTESRPKTRGRHFSLSTLVVPREGCISKTIGR